MSRPVDPFHAFTRRELLRRGAATGAAFGLTGALAACGRDASSPDQNRRGERPHHGGTLNIGFVSGGSSETVDPHRTVSFIDGARAINLFEGLTSRRANGTIGMDLAESMEPNHVATEWQIKLLSGVTFHNGKSFGADDVLYTWRRIIEGKLSGAPYLEAVDLDRSRRVSDREIRLVLKRPIGDVPRMFNTHVLHIVPEGATDRELGHHPVGTGPFKFSSFTAGQRSVFERFAHYREAPKPYVDKLVFISFDDSTARLNALLAGQIAAMEQPDFAQAQAHADDQAVRLLIAKSSGCSPIYMRLDAEPFSDDKVRQALRLAIDRPKTLEVALSGYGSVGNDVFGKGSPSYNDSLPQREYDPEQARTLLKAAGRADLRVELITAPAGPGLVESATAFAEQARAAGITIKPRRVAAGDLFNTDRYYLKAAFGQTQWTDFSFEEIAPQAYLSDGPFNETAWHDPSWDKRFLEAQGTLDDGKRNESYRELERDLYERGGHIIWAFQDVVDLVSRKVEGVTPHPYFPLGRYAFKNWWLS